MTTFNEIHVSNDDTIELFTNLKPDERIFTYFMFRASLPFNKIYRDQNHIHTNEIIQAFEFLYKNKTNIEPSILEEIKTYLVYLWSNHGIYFMTEDSNSKRTPSRLNMTYLSEDTFENLLETLHYPYPFEHLIPSIFYNDVDPEMVVDGSIEQSGNNYYGNGFTEDHYNLLSPEHKNKINAYFSLNTNNDPVMTPYSVNEKYSNELTIAIFWLDKALDHVKECPDMFDLHMANSLQLLIEYFKLGDEEKFKQHSIEWLKTNNNLDYILGFIETYHDPKSIRGQAGGEITVKLANMDKINPILLEIQQRVPIPDEYKKEQDSKITINVSLNRILFATGDYGPQSITAAYCLPNYDDIVLKHGSKQILYKSQKSLSETLNPSVAKLFRTSNKIDFIEKYDNDNTIDDDLWDVQVLLHEISHASGRYHEHTFTQDDNLFVGGVTYNIGDTIQITDENYAEFVKEDSAALEELRAEINALYMSITEIDVLSEAGLFKNWLTILGKEELQKRCIIQMCENVWGGLMSQGDNLEQIKGAHAKANYVLTNYLLECGGISINKEIKIIEDIPYTFLEIVVDDFKKAYKNIIELLQIVQKIKSTGDGIRCKKLFDIYTRYPITIEKSREYRNYLIEYGSKVVGNVKTTVKIFPQFIPVFSDDKLVDVINKISDDIFEQNLYQESLTLSYDY